MKPQAMCLAALALAAACAPSAIADRIHGDHFRVIVHQGSHLTLKPGVTDIDKLTTVECGGATDCILVIQTQFWSGGQVTICTYVDGKPADPGCHLTSGEFQLLTLQTKSHLSPGPHTVHTTFEEHVQGDYFIDGYDIVYTIYQR